MLVRRDISLVDGKEVESEVARGTEYQMRKARATAMGDLIIQGENFTFSVRKVKYVDKLTDHTYALHQQGRIWTLKRHL